jgi:hypothetical protein
MSKRKKQSNILPPLQKKIVLYLAKNDPQTINQTAKKIKHSYKPSWIAFNVLEEKKIIKKTDVKTYRNREYPRYWLTQAGVFIALVEGAESQNLLQRTIKTYPDDKTLQCAIEISPLMGLEGFRIALSAIQDKGKLDDSDTSRMLFAGMQREMSLEQFKELFRILKKYPSEYERAKKQMSAMHTLLMKLLSLT